MIDPSLLRDDIQRVVISGSLALVLAVVVVTLPADNSSLTLLGQVTPCNTAFTGLDGRPVCNNGSCPDGKRCSLIPGGTIGPNGEQTFSCGCMGPYDPPPPVPFNPCGITGAAPEGGVSCGGQCPTGQFCSGNSGVPGGSTSCFCTTTPPPGFIEEEYFDYDYVDDEGIQHYEIELYGNPEEPHQDGDDKFDLGRYNDTAPQPSNPRMQDLGIVGHEEIILPQCPQNQVLVLKVDGTVMCCPPTGCVSHDFPPQRPSAPIDPTLNDYFEQRQMIHTPHRAAEEERIIREAAQDVVGNPDEIIERLQEEARRLQEAEKAQRQIEAESANQMIRQLQEANAGEREIGFLQTVWEFLFGT
jgi:hypothetical protein